MSSLRKPFVSSVVDSSRAVIRVLYTFSCNISNMLLSTGFKSDECGGHSWSGINSGVSFCNNSTVVCAQWAFQLLLGSIETSFRWGGKRLHHFEANLIRKRCINAMQSAILATEILSVCTSRSGVLSRRMKIRSCGFQHLVGQSL